MNDSAMLMPITAKIMTIVNSCAWSEPKNPLKKSLSRAMEPYLAMHPAIT